MPSLRRRVRLPWVPRGLRLELEVAARRDEDGELVAVKARMGGTPARRGWLMASSESPLVTDELLGSQADWILAKDARRWAAIHRRWAAPLSEAERLARAGVIELECRLTDDLGLEGYVGWRLVDEAREVAHRVRAAKFAVRTDLERDLRDGDLIERLRTHRPPKGMSWNDYVRVLRAAEYWRDRVKSGRLPQERALAALVAHSKWPWTPARRALLAEVLGLADHELFEPKRWTIRVRGPITHDEGSVWAEEVDTVALALAGRVHGIVCIENHQTYNALYPLSGQGWILLQMGGPLPAECRLLSRLQRLAPDRPVYAAFDLDPAGISIALMVMERAAVAFRPDLMTPEILYGTTHLELEPWDREMLNDLAGRSGDFEPLRAAIVERDGKGEQESVDVILEEVLVGVTGDGPAPPVISTVLPAAQRKRLHLEAAARRRAREDSNL